MTDPSSDAGSPRVRPLPGERRSVVWSASWFFFVLLSYSVVRPVRETMGAIGGTKQLQGLMLVTFAAMLVAVPAYAWLVSRLPRRWLVRVVFHFFCACLIAFSLAMRSESEAIQTWAARVFFVWVNIYALFATSVFWSVLADLFTSGQGKRLFGYIAAGGTIGAILGSLLTSQIATSLSTASLLVIPVVTIQAGLWCAWRLEKQAARLSAVDVDPSLAASDVDEAPTGGGLWAGIVGVSRSPYLAMICVFLFCVQAAGTHLYFQQAEIVAANFSQRGDQTKFFAWVDFGTQTLTLLTQFFLSGLLLRRAGVSVALMLLPLIYVVGFIALAMTQSLATIVTMMIAVRSIGYGVTVPAREVLFTVVDREQKYKSKSFIDTVVLRGGDAISGQVFGFLRVGWSWSLGVLNLAALPLVVGWIVVAWQLGKRQQAKADRPRDLPATAEK